MNKMKMMLGAGMLALFGLATQGMAYDGGKHDGMRDGDRSHAKPSIEKRVEHMQKSLGLSDMQAQKIKVIFQAYDGAKGSKHEGKRAMRETMRNLDPSAADYDQRVNALAEQQGQRLTRSIKEKAAVRKDIAAVLTPEQREKVKLMHQKRGKKGYGKHHRGNQACNK